MLSARPRHFLMALAVGLALLSLLGVPGGAAAADPAKKDKKPDNIGKPAKFDTADGVKLEGTLYVPSVKKEAVVLLLHDVSKGSNNSHVDGWNLLAEKLYKAGYPVLSFDFRGFGDSKNVKEKFWDRENKHNLMVLRAKPGGKLPDTIDQASFPPRYYPCLINDITAAKAYLDRRNDARELNSSNLIIIGAGQGATLGAMWMAEEWHRCRATAIPLMGPPTLDEPEGKDQACAIWLSISPTLGRGRGITVPLRSWMAEVGGKRKVPMAFVYGSKDAFGRRIAASCLAAIDTKKNKLELTGPYGKTPTQLTGSKLLQKDLGVADNIIINDYLKKVMEVRREEWKNRKAEEEPYFWSLNRVPVLCKKPKEANTRPMGVDDELYRYLMRGGR